MKFFYLSLFFTFHCFLFNSQVEFEYAEKIDSTNIRKHLAVLAHDSLLGRNTGELGQKKAAKYLQEEFIKIGLDSLTTEYLQAFYLLNKIEKGNLIINGSKLDYIADFASFNSPSVFKLKISKTKHFNYDEFVSNKTKESSVLVSVNSFQEIDMDFIKKSGIKNIFFLVKNYNSKLFEDNNKKIEIIKKEHQNIFYVDASKVNKIKKWNKLSLNFKFKDKNSCIKTENVLAKLEGSDPILKNEYIVISAHYDHLGVKNGLVYNGADDNGSGTSALLEIARIFKQASLNGVKLKRSVLFICFTGEEHGLLGSEYYSKNPLIPLKKTIANFNIDMIGRVDASKEKNKFSVYAIGSDKISLDFHAIHEKTAKKHNKLNIDYTYNDPKNKEKLYYRSDHYNFAKNGIPSIFYFGGFHKDYHQTTDDIEKINFTKIKTISELVFLTMWNVGNQ
jgi:hypothetical protein